jgi:curved DNA-binding protein CbpA
MSSAFDNFDLYEELELTKEATPEEIKKAYKKLALV